MVFIVTGDGEGGPVSFTCDSARAALEKARGLDHQGMRDILIDAGGQEFAPTDFRRLFTGSRVVDSRGETADQDESGGALS
jgi:hypothetical protein